MEKTEAMATARHDAYQAAIKALQAQKVSRARWARKISTLLDAKITKVFNDKDNGIIYSEELEDNATQAKMVELLATIFDAKAAEKHDVNLKGDLTINLIDRFGGGK